MSSNSSSDNSKGSSALHPPTTNNRHRFQTSTFSLSIYSESKENKTNELNCAPSAFRSGDGRPLQYPSSCCPLRRHPEAALSYSEFYWSPDHPLCPFRFVDREREGDKKRRPIARTGPRGFLPPPPLRSPLLSLRMNNEWKVFLYVARSTIPNGGLGLFTANFIPSSSRPFLYYSGEILTEAQILQRYGSPLNANPSANYVAALSGCYIDAINPHISGAARYINHKPSSEANCRLNQYGGIRAIKNIQPHSELFYTYNANWTRFFSDASAAASPSYSSVSSSSTGSSSALAASSTSSAKSAAMARK